ncbi:MAG: PTS sugar transporter subunit IIA [bacterium]
MIRTTETNIPLSRLTIPPLINLYLKSNNREEVLFEIAKIAYESGLTPSIKILFEGLKKRERMLSTAVGDGIAIPHPRHPSNKLFKTPNIVICRTQKGINFDAPDNKKVHLFFLICAPDVCIHLRLLAKVSKLLHAKNIIQKFMEAYSGEEVIKILLEFERQVIYPI